MTKDDIFKKIQDIVNNNPVIVLGSGASIGYGIASMGKLATLLSSHFSSKTYTDPDCNESVETFLDNINKGMGLEDALLSVRMPNEIEEEIRMLVWQEINTSDVSVYNRVLNDEKLALTELLDHMIYDRKDQIVNIVTTNYDRIAEYSVCQIQAYLNTLFTNKPIGEFDATLSSGKVQQAYTGMVNVLKVHGSLDWFEKNGKQYSFVNSKEIPVSYTPCIITPGTNKYEKTSQPPYRDIMQLVDNIFKQTSGFLCIGYGFNDIHVHPNLLKHSSNRKKTILIITKEITDAIQKRIIDTKLYPYIIVADNAGKGSVIYDSSESAPLYFDKEVFWTIPGLCKIIK